MMFHPLKKMQAVPLAGCQADCGKGKPGKKCIPGQYEP